MYYKLKFVSSLIDSVSWNEQTKEITVYFHNGHEYTYPDFTYEEYQEFINSTSKGKWFSVNLKHKNHTKHVKPTKV